MITKSNILAWFANSFPTRAHTLGFFPIGCFKDKYKSTFWSAFLMLIPFNVMTKSKV